METSRTLHKELKKILTKNYKKFKIEDDNNSAINSILLSILKENNNIELNAGKLLNYIEQHLARGNTEEMDIRIEDLKIENEENIKFNDKIITIIRNILYLKLGGNQLENKIGDNEFAILSEIFHSCIKVYQETGKVKEFNSDKCEHTIILEEEKKGYYCPYIYDINLLFSDEYNKTKQIEGKGKIINIKGDGNCGFYSFIHSIKSMEYNTEKKNIKPLVEKIKKAKELKDNDEIYYETKIVKDLRKFLSSLYETSSPRKKSILKDKEWMNDEDIELLAKEFNLFIGIFKYHKGIYDLYFYGDEKKEKIFFLLKNQHFNIFYPSQNFLK